MHRLIRQLDACFSFSAVQVPKNIYILFRKTHLFFRYLKFSPDKAMHFILRFQVSLY